MNIKKIEFIPGAGVHIIYTQTNTLYDADGKEVIVEGKAEQSAFGLNHFAADLRNPTADELDKGKQRISEALQTLMQQSDADLIAENARLLTEITVERSAKEQAIADRDAANAARDKLLQSSQRQDAESNPNPG